MKREKNYNSPTLCIDLNKRPLLPAQKCIPSHLNHDASVLFRCSANSFIIFFFSLSPRARYRMFSSDFSCDVLMPPIFMVILELQEFSKFEYQTEKISLQSAFTRVIFGILLFASEDNWNRKTFVVNKVLFIMAHSCYF